MKLKLLAISAWLLFQGHQGQSHRLKRALGGCSTNPSNMDRDNVVDDGDMMSLSCNSDNKVLACIWRHTDPISEKQSGSGNLGYPSISCTGSPGDGGGSCQDDSRVTFRTTESACAIDVSNTKPEDTGRWLLTMITSQGSSSNSGSKSEDKRFEVYTYNISKVEMVDEDLNQETTIDTSYNWDTKEEKWIDGKNGFESIEFSCMAYGGRPTPEFLWYIDNNDNDDLSEEDHFNVATSPIGSDYDFIENYQSTMEFSIDHNLIDKLDSYGIDTNPENGLFSFEVNCEVTQGRSSANTQRDSIRINVRREHDNGKLKKSTVGVIVGVVLAGVLILIAVGLLVFAKATNSWCFADDYNDPANARSHPNARMGRGPQSNQQPQVYRDNIDEKKSATRRSSTSSNNTSPLKPASAPQQKQNEWLPDSRKSAHYSATPTLAANLNTTPKQIRTNTTKPPTSSSTSSSSSNNEQPPPRPPKDGLQYANLDHKAFMQDPRNRVLPPGGSLPPSANTTYATVTTREVTQTSSRKFGGGSYGNQKM